jgi:hypothetical protein
MSVAECFQPEGLGSHSRHYEDGCVAGCSLADVYQRLRTAYCISHRLGS